MNLKNVALSTTIILCLLSGQQLSAQTIFDPIADAYGTWRWVGDRDDTLILVIKKVTQTGTPARPVLSQLFGFHKYVEHGKLVESNLALMTDTISAAASINGGKSDGGIGINFRDLTRDRWFSGVFHILKDFPGHAWLEMKWIGERFNIPGSWEHPAGRTVPDNIVLERIPKY